MPVQREQCFWKHDETLECCREASTGLSGGAGIKVRALGKKLLCIITPNLARSKRKKATSAATKSTKTTTATASSSTTTTTASSGGLDQDKIKKLLKLLDKATSKQ